MTDLRALAVALQGFVDTTALDAALDLAADETWRVAVIGRRSTGKSTLVNALVGEGIRPTGLGGVTVEAEELVHPALPNTALVDTPGIEDHLRDARALAPWLADVDLVIWLVDGLQPMARVARETVAEAMPAGTEVVIGVTRLDLADEGPDAVLERVRRLAAPLEPRDVLPLDPRSLLRGALVDPTSRPVHLLEPRGGSRRRREAVRAALAACRSALDDVPRPPSASTLRASVAGLWRQAVRGAITRARDLGSLERAAAAAPADVVAALEADPDLSPLVGAHGPPPLPSLRADVTGPVDRLADLLGGSSARARDARARGAAWMMEGDLVLDDWFAAACHSAAPLPADRRQAVENRLEEAYNAASTRS